MTSSIRTYGFGISGFRRFDLTDVFRDRSEGSRNPLYQLEFTVKDMGGCCMGLIAYLSYDFSEGKTTTYVYKFCEDGTTRWRKVSIPFLPYGTDVTLRDIFPNIDSVKIGNIPMPPSFVNRTLTGGWGDTVRTYSIQIRRPNIYSWNCTLVRYGYPVLEQRYLNINNNDSLFFSTVKCTLSFEDPVDYVNGKIRRTMTIVCTHADSVMYCGTGPFYVVPRYWYATKPYTGPIGYSDSLPYSLDIRCNNFLIASLVNGYCPLLEPIDFGIQEAELLEYQKWVSSFRVVPDTSRISTQDTCRFKLEVLRTSSQFTLLVSPSPFNSQLSITITTAIENNLTISIYDISGNLVKVIFEGDLDAGMHSFIWDGLDASGKQCVSGIYFISAVCGEQKTKVKATLVR